ncbi:MAG: hypothetical protein Q9205_006481 [Flavoplaca limonia]
MLLRWSIPFLVAFPLLVQAFPAISTRAPPVLEDIPEESDVCEDYSSCSIKGYDYWNTLHDTLKNPQPVDRADTTAHFQRYYASEFADYYLIELENPPIELAMRSRGMNLADMGLWEVNAFDPVQKTRSKLMAFYNAFDTAAGIIVAKANYRSNDRTASENKLQWSEIMYQTWKLASAQEKEEGKPYGPISNLRVVVQDQVENAETLKIVETAYVNNNWEPDGDPEWRTWTEDSAQSFFYSILGTPNVKGTVWLLKDHAAEIGRKDISAIHTRWYGQLDIWYASSTYMPSMMLLRALTAASDSNNSCADLSCKRFADLR